MRNESQRHLLVCRTLCRWTAVLIIGGIRKRLMEQSPPYRPIAFVRRAAVDRYCAGTCVDQHGRFQALSPESEEEEDGPPGTFEHRLFDPSTGRATREDR